MHIGRIVAVYTAEPTQSPVPAELDEHPAREYQQESGVPHGVEAQPAASEQHEETSEPPVQRRV